MAASPAYRSRAARCLVGRSRRCWSFWPWRATRSSASSASRLTGTDRPPRTARDLPSAVTVLLTSRLCRPAAPLPASSSSAPASAARAATGPVGSIAIRPSTTAARTPSRTRPESERPPKSRSRPVTTMVLPAPVSPVRTVRPRDNSRTASSMTPRPRMCISSSTERKSIRTSSRMPLRSHPDRRRPRSSDQLRSELCGSLDQPTYSVEVAGDGVDRTCNLVSIDWLASAYRDLANIGGDFHACCLGALSDRSYFLRGEAHRNGHVAADGDRNRLFPLGIVDLDHVLEVAHYACSHAATGRTPLPLPTICAMTTAFLPPLVVDQNSTRSGFSRFRRIVSAFQITCSISLAVNLRVACAHPTR